MTWWLDCQLDWHQRLACPNLLSWDGQLFTITFPWISAGQVIELPPQGNSKQIWYPSQKWPGVFSVCLTTKVSLVCNSALVSIQWPHTFTLFLFGMRSISFGGKPHLAREHDVRRRFVKKKKQKLIVRWHGALIILLSSSHTQSQSGKKFKSWVIEHTS